MNGMAVNIALEPCPFCGGKAKINRRNITPFVECADLDCFSLGPTRDTWKEAVAAWNRRTPDAATSGEARPSGRPQAVANDVSDTGRGASPK